MAHCHLPIKNLEPIQLFLILPLQMPKVKKHPKGCFLALVQNLVNNQNPVHYQQNIRTLARVRS